MMIIKGKASKSLADLNAIKPDGNLDSQKVIPEKQRIKMHQELEASKALKLKRSRSRKTEHHSQNDTAPTKNQESNK